MLYHKGQKNLNPRCSETQITEHDQYVEYKIRIMIENNGYGIDLPVALLLEEKEQLVLPEDQVVLSEEQHVLPEVHHVLPKEQLVLPKEVQLVLPEQKPRALLEQLVLPEEDPIVLPEEEPIALLKQEPLEGTVTIDELKNNYNSNDTLAKIDMKTIYDNIRVNSHDQYPSNLVKLMKTIRNTFSPTSSDPGIHQSIDPGTVEEDKPLVVVKEKEKYDPEMVAEGKEQNLEFNDYLETNNSKTNSMNDNQINEFNKHSNAKIEPDAKIEPAATIEPNNIDDANINSNTEILKLESGCTIRDTHRYSSIDLSDPSTYPNHKNPFPCDKVEESKTVLPLYDLSHDCEQKEMQPDIAESVYLAKTYLYSTESDNDSSNIGDSRTSNICDDDNVLNKMDQEKKQLIGESSKVDLQINSMTNESVPAMPTISPLKHVNSYANINLGRFGGFGGFSGIISNMITTGASVVANTMSISNSAGNNTGSGSTELDTMNATEANKHKSTNIPIALPFHELHVSTTLIDNDQNKTSIISYSTNSLDRSDDAVKSSYDNTYFVKMLDRPLVPSETNKEFVNESLIDQTVGQTSDKTGDQLVDKTVDKTIGQIDDPTIKPVKLNQILGSNNDKSFNDESFNDKSLVRKQRALSKDSIDPIDMITKLDKNPQAYEEIKKTTDELQKKTIEARRLLKWVADASDTKCFNCRTEFTLLCRRHHCRHCGRLFCSVCSNYSVVLPHEILNKLPDKPQTYMDMFWEDNKNNVKVCKNCYAYANQILMVRKTIKIFEACQLTLGELNTLGSFSPMWKVAANFIMAKFREIQYKLSIEDLTVQEKRMLWVNRNHLSGHSRWMVQLIKTTNLNNQYARLILEKLIKKNRKNRCRDLMCTRFCSKTIGITDMLDLIRYNNNYPVISDIVKQCLIEINSNNLIHYLPFLVFNVKNNNFILTILLEKGKDDFIFMNNLYWCIKVYCPDDDIRMAIMIRALNYIQENTAKIFRSRFKKMLMMEKLNVKSVHLLNDTGDDIILPVCSHLTFKKVDPNIKIVDSNSQPAIINFIDEKGVPKPIMFKNDDVRKDYIVLNIINIIQDILKNEEDLEIDIVKYEVIPTSKTSGYIEIVEDSATIFHITQRSELTNYILNNNGNILIKSFREKFIKSTALYCVLSYLLGIGDRHLNNIMVTKSGLLFHIDFGFILGQDPKYSNRLIRLNPDIINVLGGYDSDDYVYFRKVCVKIYNRMRLHVNLFSSLLSIIPSVDPSISLDVIKRELTERFEIGENCLEAATHMDNKVASGSNLEYWVIDTLYKSTQSGIFKGVAYVAGSFLNIFKNK
jgi:hypothetical protein